MGGAGKDCSRRLVPVLEEDPFCADLDVWSRPLEMKKRSSPSDAGTGSAFVREHDFKMLCRCCADAWTLPGDPACVKKKVVPLMGGDRSAVDRGAAKQFEQIHCSGLVYAPTHIM
jgi:hypothetical protein